jgi:molecular chaperone DnaK (HSP70)
MVSLGNKQRFIGEAARPQQTTNFKNTVSQFKRLIGRRYDDPEAQAELQNAPFKHQALPDGRIGIVVCLLMDTLPRPM